jgi:hypothetical protein
MCRDRHERAVDNRDLEPLPDSARALDAVHRASEMNVHQYEVRNLSLGELDGDFQRTPSR